MLTSRQPQRVGTFRLRFSNRAIHPGSARRFIESCNGARGAFIKEFECAICQRSSRTQVTVQPHEPSLRIPKGPAQPYASTPGSIRSCRPRPALTSHPTLPRPSMASRPTRPIPPLSSRRRAQLSIPQPMPKVAKANPGRAASSGPIGGSGVSSVSCGGVPGIGERHD
jgi:hypothetical protein